MGRYKSEKFYEFKKNTILGAATKIFSTKGLDKATIRAIASEADISTGAVYSMFDGKEEIYADLLRGSLAHLYDYVAEQTAKAETPNAKVRASVSAFYDYYSERRFEFELGLYSFSGLKRGSLGPERDSELNAALNKVLDEIAHSIREASPHTTEERVQLERNSIFTALVGALSLGQTGRAVSVGTTPEAVLETQIHDLLDRLQK